MRRYAALLLVTSVAACADPTSGVSPLSTETATPPPSANATAVTPQAEVVTVVLHNDAPRWVVAPISALPKHETPYWFVDFGIPGRSGVQSAQQYATLAPGAVLTTTFSAPPRALRGRRAWLHGAAVYSGAVAAGTAAPAARAIKCGPSAPAATIVAHQYVVEFHLVVETKGTLSYLRCR